MAKLPTHLSARARRSLERVIKSLTVKMPRRSIGHLLTTQRDFLCGTLALGSVASAPIVAAIPAGPPTCGPELPAYVFTYRWRPSPNALVG